MANNQEKNGEFDTNTTPPPPTTTITTTPTAPMTTANINEQDPISKSQKELISKSITGKVKWFNVKRGYGFVCRDDNHEDIFIHQSAIVKSNPEHPRKSVGENEHILFDIVKGTKGNEAANVSAIDGNCVKGSDYALRYQRGRGRGRGTRGRGGRSRVVSEEGEMRGGGGGPQDYYRGGGGPGGPRGPRGGFRGRPYVYQVRKQPYPPYDLPPQYYYSSDYYSGGGPMRGGPPRGPYRGPRGYRGGGPPRETNIKYDYETEFFERRGPSRGRGRGRGGRGRSRGRGGRGDMRGGGGPGAPRDNVKRENDDDEHFEPEN